MPYELDLSNLTIPVAALLGASWLFSQNRTYAGIGILIAGMAWWGVDQAVKWHKMEYHRKHHY